MHSFQPVDFEQMEINPFRMIGRDWMLVTAGNEEKANTMTASWGGVGIMKEKHLFSTAMVHICIHALLEMMQVGLIKCQKARYN